ncbi:leucine-rich repeat-containing protein 74B-like [Gigantopelta aegis]|uniref:leucine-rich repeat-containing protein 74B-like n=1 Tax=Gigantopelta aegis TaxID=1735272 RepID=UPI001B88A207|nr:leucine-rich repeat-containing protein 74B-like [Gigantopelta aegis]
MMYNISNKLKLCRLFRPKRMPNQTDSTVWTQNHKLVDVIIVRPNVTPNRQLPKKLVRTPRQTSYRDGLHNRPSKKVLNQDESQEYGDERRPVGRQSLYDEHRYPTYESWLEGSPHASEEFDTDFEDEKENAAVQPAVSTGEEAEEHLPSGRENGSELSLAHIAEEVFDEQPHRFENIPELLVSPADELQSPSLEDVTALSVALTATTDTYEEQSSNRENLIEQSMIVKKAEEQSPRPETITTESLDPTGKRTYVRQCRMLGVIPASCLLRDLGKRNICLRHHYLGKEAVKALALALKDNTVTEVLNLSDNCFQDEGACYLANMMEDNCFIDHLDLSNNCIHSVGALAICRMLEVNTTLKILKLSGNQLKDVDAALFIDGLKNNQFITFLDLSHNRFSEKGGEMLAKALSYNESLVNFDLSWNSLRGKGAIAIAKALKVNTRLQIFNLSWNGFATNGAAALQGALQKNKTLRVLDLTNNRLTQPAAVKLATGIRKNTGLENLTLNLNHLGSDGLDVLLKAVAKNTNLKILSIEDMNINNANLKLIRQLEDEKEITILYGEVGEYHTNKTAATYVKLFSEFSRDHQSDLLAVFEQQDWDHTGQLTVDQLKDCLIEAGFRMTDRQLDHLVDKLDSTKTGRIHFR